MKSGKISDEDEEENASKTEKVAPAINIQNEDDEDIEDNLTANLLMGSRDVVPGQPASVFVKKTEIH